MYKKILFIISFSLSLFLLSCNQNNINPVGPQNSKDEMHSALAKAQWFTSPEEGPWPTSPYNDGVHPAFQLSNANYSFSYTAKSTYTFSFNYVRGSNCIIGINVNGTFITNVDCFDNYWQSWGVSYYTDWFNFTYNGINMKVKFNMYHFNLTNPFAAWWEPQTVQVQVEEKYVETPTGFSVSPTETSSGGHLISLSWNASTDTDVTGYEIYRQRVYLNSQGTIQHTSYFLVKTITSRTTSSWQDNQLFGTGSHASVGFYYRIRSISNIINKQSGYATRWVYLEGYDYLFP